MAEATATTDQCFLDALRRPLLSSGVLMRGALLVQRYVLFTLYFDNRVLNVWRQLVRSCSRWHVRALQGTKATHNE